MEKQVDERTRELQEINNELKTFIYKTSHDIRGPIATIIGLSDLGSKKANQPEVQSCLSNILKTGYRLDETLNNLLKIMNLKDTDVESTPLDTKKFLEIILKNTEGYKGLNINFNIDVGDELSFNTDRELIITIFKNLIDNAVMYRNLNREEAIVEVKVKEESDNTLCLVVQDNGEGIKEEIRCKIFDMFFRGNAKSKGSGLGLYIVKKAVEKIGGVIKISSIPNIMTKAEVKLKE